MKGVVKAQQSETIGMNQGTVRQFQDYDEYTTWLKAQ